MRRIARAGVMSGTLALAGALALASAMSQSTNNAAEAAGAKGSAPASTKVSDKPAADAPKHEPVVAAKTIFGAIESPAPLAARAIGFYSRGCLAGAVPVPIDGEAWQVMRLSRNRNWGHPRLISLVKRLAADGAARDGWPGLLVGDISQPRGGPMLTGHSSHQIGLDADVWLTPMPGRRLTAEEREKLSATSMLGQDRIHVDPTVFTPAHAAIIRRAASYADVERVLVHPGIKKAMCEEKDGDRQHLHKIRPYWGHHYHMHIRISCPPDSQGCRSQTPPESDNGCGKEIDDWIALLQRPPKVATPGAKPKPAPRAVTLADLPAECSTVVSAGRNEDKAKAVSTPRGSREAQSR